MVLVSRKVVPEVFEVNALSALDQRFRRWTIETEVPDSRIIVYGVPLAYAGKKGVHHHKLRCLRGKLRGIGISDHQTDIVSHDLCFLDSERARQRMNSDWGSLHVQTVSRNRRVADAGQIGCDHGKSLGQQRHDGSPHERGLRIPVQQYEGGTLPCLQEVQLDAVNLGGAQDDSIIRSRSSSRS